ncbi:MAG: tRNA(Ile)-lysidine synthase [candidate division TM6 bacterium GW2011_GWF2_30_66]|nr:MAG: tRNA(Ile)-lysidine synthase [candidate division TM6 bacterium GW2011_GWF2_30_66]
MNELENKIIKFIKKHELIQDKSKIVLGLSGGPDSVFLLHILSKLKQEGLIQEIIAAHLDHGWREESAKEAKFCLELAKKYNITCEVRKLSELELNLKFEGSKEDLGRKARRHLFELIKEKYNYDLIALAHHAQDQEETFFIRLIRGTSLSGLTSIKPKSGDYIRPLLEINKQEILEFLNSHGILYVTDPSNISHEFLRNRIRELVIPALKKCDARFEQNFKITINRLQETEFFLEQLTKEKFNEISTEISGIFYLNLNQLFKLHNIMLYRVLIYWLIKQNVKFPTGQSFLDEIIKFLAQPESQGPKEHALYQNWSIIKKKNLAHINIK